MLVMTGPIDDEEDEEDDEDEGDDAPAPSVVDDEPELEEADVRSMMVSTRKNETLSR